MAEADDQIGNPASASEGQREGGKEEHTESCVPKDEQQQGVAAPTELITASSPGAEHTISSGSGQVEGEGGGVEGEGGGVEGEGGGGVKGEGGGGVEGEGGGEGGGEVAGEGGGVEGEGGGGVEGEGGGGVEGEGGGGVEGEGGGGVEGEGGGVEGEGGGVEGGGGEMAQQPSELHTERQRKMAEVDSGSHERPGMNNGGVPEDLKHNDEVSEEEVGEEEGVEEGEEEGEEEGKEERGGRRRRRGSEDSETEGLEVQGKLDDAALVENANSFDNEWDTVEGEEGGPKDKEEEETPELPENSPMFVPTKGKFFQHDDRILPGEEEEEQEEQPPEEVKSRADVVDRWLHDLYVDSEQGPREQWEKDRDSRDFRQFETRGGRRGTGRKGARLGNFIREEDQGKLDSRSRRDPRRQGERSGGREWTRGREERGWEGRQRPDRPRQRTGFRGSGREHFDHRRRREDSHTKEEDEGAPAENGKEWQDHIESKAAVPKTHWSDIDEDDYDESASFQTKDDVGRNNLKLTTESAKPERESSDTHRKRENRNAKQGSRSLFSVQSGGGSSAKTHQTKVFSLTQESKLIVTPRGRGRGRGWRERLGPPPPQVGIRSEKVEPPTVGIESGVTVIEPLEKRLTQEQTDKSTETSSNSGLPLVSEVESSPPRQQNQDETASEALKINSEERKGEPEESTPPVSQAPLTQVSKPKRYSSQRQKQSGEKQPEQQQWQQGQQGPTWAATTFVDPAAYHEILAQQIKMLQLQQTMVGTPSNVMFQQNPVFQQNPMFLQQMQQYMWLQQQYQQQHEQQTGVAELPSYPQQVSIPMAPQLTTAVNPEGVKQGYTSPGGLFIPPIAPEEQKRQPQQIIQKPRSQAIPIVPPKEGD